MKKTITILCTLICASLFFISCNDGSIEKDAQKYADLMCKAQKLATDAVKNAASGDLSAISESTKLAAEATSLAQEMQGKYKDAADYQKFTSAYLKAMANCK